MSRPIHSEQQTANLSHAWSDHHSNRVMQNINGWMDLLLSLTKVMKFVVNTGTGKITGQKTKWEKAISVESLVKYTVQSVNEMS